MRFGAMLGVLALLIPVFGEVNMKLEWRDGKSMPAPAAVAGVVMRRGLVVAGGTSWQNGVKLWLRHARLYDIARDAWSDLPLLPEPLGVASAVAVGDAVYVLGGSDGESTSKQVYRLRPGATAWESGPPLPGPRVYAGADAIGPRIYLAAASDSVKSTRGSTELLALDTSKPHPTWHKLAPLPGHARTLAGVVAAEGKVYLFGGYTDLAPGKPGNLADAWTYDPSADRWDRLPDLPVANRYMGITAWDPDTIFLLGGAITQANGADAITDRVWAYRVREKRYAEIGKLPQVNAGMVFGRAGSRLVGAGGEPAAKTREASVWIATPHGAH